MSEADRIKWDTRYGTEGPESWEPSTFLQSLDSVLPRSGRALDVAGGAGRNALWLARRGLRVTLVDISTVALELAHEHAGGSGVVLDLQAADLEVDDLPRGPFDLVICFNFLRRALYRRFSEPLAPGGFLVCVQPTRSNLERHARPPAPFLLEDGELPSLLHGLDMIVYEEGWMSNGRHEARLVGRKPSVDSSRRHPPTEEPP